MDLLEQAAAWLENQRQRFLSRTVTYQRGNQSVQLSATLGSTRYELMDEAGATVQVRGTDFIVAAGELVLGGRVTTPRAGDRIRLPQGGTVLVFEVLDLAGEGPWRPADPFGRTLRIHARQIDQETP